LTGRLLTGQAIAQHGTLITFPVQTGLSKDQERCDQTVVHAKRSAMDRNSIIALFCTVVLNVDLREGIGFIQQSKKGKNSVPFTRYLLNYEMKQTSF
jgi:hypothetical protein